MNKINEQNENIQSGAQKLEKIIKAQSFREYKEFLWLQKKNEFGIRLESYLTKSSQRRKMKKAFEQLKINSLSSEIQDKMQDKFQVYARYVRRMV